MAELSCDMKCLKYLLFFVNFIVWVCGLAVLVFGIISRVQAGGWADLVKDASVTDATNILIAAGAFVMIIGFFGCCGAWKQNRQFLIIYIILLVLIFILEIASGIYAYTRKDKAIISLQNGFDKAIKNSYEQGGKVNQGFTKAVDWFQQKVKCCGTTGPKSWNGTKYIKTQTNKILVPLSCCKNKKQINCNNGNNYTTLEASKRIYTKGCFPAGKKFLMDHMLQIGGIGIGIAFVQLLGIVFAILLVRAINENKLD